MAGYQIKVTMEGTKPPMWRRLAIPDKISFMSLHHILQVSFGWMEMHLHDFTFQYVKISVGNREYADVDYEEAEVLADDFLRAGWIRYTYDFGDSWEHKIVLEKELPDYVARFPQVLKFKRNNFVEDSGGVWNAEEQGPFDMEGVNEMLAQVCICQANPNAQSADELGICPDQIKRKREHQQAAFKQIREAFLAVQELQMYDKEMPAPIDVCNRAIAAYYEHLQVKDGWGLLDTDQDMQQLLERDGIVHLFNLWKYLSGEQNSEIPTSQALAQRIVAEWKAHPEFLPLLFKAEELKDFIRWVRTGVMEELPDEECLLVLSMWGFAEVHVHKERGTQVMGIAFPKDVDILVSWLEKQDLNALERDWERIWERLYGLVLCYGYIDMEVMHEKYVQRFGGISWKDFKRCLYLKGRFRDGIATGSVRDSHRPWVALSEAFAEYALLGQLEYSERLDYADFTKKQILGMSRTGFASIYPQWEELLEPLNRLGMDLEESCELLGVLYESVMHGDGMHDLLNMVKEWLPDEKAAETSGDDWELLQKQLCICWSVTGVAALKGHSRLEIAEKTGKSVFEIAAADDYRLPDFAVPVQKYGRVIEMRRSMARPQGDMAESEALAIDPDDSCPCGSGKRYRQCCGRRKGRGMVEEDLLRN